MGTAQADTIYMSLRTPFATHCTLVYGSCEWLLRLSLFVLLWVNSFSETWKAVAGKKPVKLTSVEETAKNVYW